MRRINRFTRCNHVHPIFRFKQLQDLSYIPCGGIPLLRFQSDVKEPPFLPLAALSDLLAPIKVPGLLRLHSECRIQAPSPAGSLELKLKAIRRRSQGQVCRPHDTRSLTGTQMRSAKLWRRLSLIRKPRSQEPQPQVRPRRVLR